LGLFFKKEQLGSFFISAKISKNQKFCEFIYAFYILFGTRNHQAGSSAHGQSPAPVIGLRNTHELTII